MSMQRKKIQFNIGGIGKAPSAAAPPGAAPDVDEATPSAPYSPTRPTTSPEREEIPYCLHMLPLNTFKAVIAVYALERD